MSVNKKKLSLYENKIKTKERQDKLQKVLKRTPKLTTFFQSSIISTNDINNNDSSSNIQEPKVSDINI